MTVTAEEDFRDFVVARWGELEPVAHLVTLDGPTARRVTTDALADLHGQWGQPARRGDAGCRRPPRRARRGPRRGPAPTPRRGRGDGQARRRAPRPAGRRPDDPSSPPCCRWCAAPPRSSGRCSAAATVWGLDPGRVADLLGMPPAAVRDADLAVRRRLLAAHTAARAAAGWEPAEWALDRDLDDALDLLLGDHADPPDAVALVGERHRQVRRRSVVLGTGATLAAGAVDRLGRRRGR